MAVLQKVDHVGAVAQLGERCVRNAEVGSSSLLRSTFLNSKWPKELGGSSCSLFCRGTRFGDTFWSLFGTISRPAEHGRIIRHRPPWQAGSSPDQRQRAARFRSRRIFYWVGTRSLGVEETQEPTHVDELPCLIENVGRSLGSHLDPERFTGPIQINQADWQTTVQ
jgi:hypothetical protein